MLNINKKDAKSDHVSTSYPNGRFYWAVDDTYGIYIPSTPCKIEHSNIAGASSGRDETGVMHIDWVRRDVRKVLLHYNAITATELNYMMSKMQGKEFSFTYYDQGDPNGTNGVVTFNGYVGESNYEFYTYSSLFNEPVYVNFDIHVIEL